MNLNYLSAEIEDICYLGKAVVWDSKIMIICNKLYTYFDVNYPNLSSSFYILSKIP